MAHWSDVPCVIGPGVPTKSGYSLASFEGKQQRGHRVAWQKAYGPIPEDDHVLHHCDVRACIEPLHLFLGSHLVNMQDMAQKGRRASFRGERNGRSRVCGTEVQAIRSIYGAKMATQKELGALFGIHQTQVSNIVRGKQWAGI